MCVKDLLIVADPAATCVQNVLVLCLWGDLCQLYFQLKNFTSNIPILVKKVRSGKIDFNFLQLCDSVCYFWTVLELLKTVTFVHPESEAESVLAASGRYEIGLQSACVHNYAALATDY